jgi:hypothetical protein
VAAGLAAAAASVVAVMQGADAFGAVMRVSTDQVRMTIDGRSRLPFRIRWIATTTHPAKVSQVDFLVDGKLIWIEHVAPYVFGGDDHGTHEGYFFTSWLSPRRHHFTARATYLSGKHVSDSVVARVKRSPVPPPAIAGSWTRKVTKADLKKAGHNPPPAGRWHLVFDRVGAWELDPHGSGVVNAIHIGKGKLTVYAPIQLAPFSNGQGGVTRYHHHNIGGTDCFYYDGPSGTYTWKVVGSRLTLKGNSEKCGYRAAVWEGVWTRNPRFRSGVPSPGLGPGRTLESSLALRHVAT